VSEFTVFISRMDIVFITLLSIRAGHRLTDSDCGSVAYLQ